MNAPTGKLTGISDIDIELSSFYRLRSEMLDSFADIEVSLFVYLSQHKAIKISETAPLGHKVEAAKKVPAGPQKSKELKSKCDAELNRLSDFLKLRANLVHSRMEIAITNNSQIIAIFRNAKNATMDQKCASIFTLLEFRKFVSALQNQQKSLNQALTARNSNVQSKADSKQR
jgi:hypothetical protein